MSVLKGLLRKPLVTVICVLLIVAAVLLTMLDAAMPQAAQVTLPTVETLDLAIFRMDVVQKSINNAFEWVNMYEGVDETFSKQYEVDVRTFGGAYAEGLITADAAAPGKYSTTYISFPSYMVILIGTCTNVEQTYSDRAKYYTNYYTLEVDEVVYQNESNPMQIQTVRYRESARVPETLEVGKKYLFWGHINENAANSDQVFAPGNRTLQGAEKVVEQEGLHWIKEADKGLGNFMPLISELNGSLEEFLQTEAGQIWQKAVFDKIEVCESAFGIVGTDYLESIPAWNTGDCKLTEGQVFSQEHYEAGERVCLISEEVATANGLRVGDSLPLKLFSSDAIYDYAMLKYQNTFDPYAGFIEEGEWRVIGIYTSDYTAGEDYQIHPNVIFVPNKTVTCFSKNNGWFTRSFRPGMSSTSAVSVILPEGGWEQFELRAETSGYGGFFEYNNGKTPENVAAREAQELALATWQESAVAKTKPFPMIAAGLIFAAMLIFALSKKKEIEQFYSIETSGGKLFAHLFVQSVIVGVVALGLSMIVAKFTVPQAATEMLYRLADPAYADAWMADLSIEMREPLSALGWQALILFVSALLSCTVGVKRKFHFEYHERE